MDGKCLRGSSDEGPGTYTHLVSAWASANNLLLAQEKVAGKSNGITAIPKLRRILELKNCIVTIDAMGCQREIAKTIMERGADYILEDNAAQNFSLLNRIGLNVIKNAKVSSMGVKGHRKKAGWDNDYLLYALKSFDVIKN
ncbi:MAG: ISAs1 family transposase [Muribaculaceae bacterium]|nr:ISAs1 family transposase [Muribaculaceae bacterium]